MSLDIDTKRVSAISAICAYRSRNDITGYNYGDAINGFCLDMYCRAFRPSYSSYLHVWVREVLGAWDVLSG
jgi:hypothetical protein